MAYFLRGYVSFRECRWSVTCVKTCFPKNQHHNGNSPFFEEINHQMVGFRFPRTSGMFDCSLYAEKSRRTYFTSIGIICWNQLTITWTTDISLQFSNSKHSSINDYVLVIELEHHLQLALIINSLLTMLVENHGDNTAKKSNCAFWGHYEVRLSCPNWLLGF